MTLYGDFKELAIAWRGSGWRVRIFLILALVLASSAIASLSETIAKWKGFLLTGLSFYETALREPIANGLAVVAGVKPAPHFLDYLVLLFLLTMALLRKTLYTLKSTRSRFERRTDLVGITLMMLGLVFNVGVAVLAPQWLATIDSSAYRSQAIWTYGFVTVLAILPPRSAAQFLLFMHLFVPVLLVCLLAAVNLGLK